MHPQRKEGITMVKKILTTCILTIMILQSIGSAVIATVEIINETNVGNDALVVPENEENQEIEIETPSTENPEDGALSDEETNNNNVGVDDPVHPNNNQNEENNQNIVNNPEQPEAQPLEPMSITSANLGPLITFARQGQSGLITQITLVTNGTQAERVVNIDSILNGIAIQPRSYVVNTKYKHCNNKWKWFASTMA